MTTVLSKPPRGSAGSAHTHSTSVSGFSHDCVCAHTVCVLVADVGVCCLWLCCCWCVYTGTDCGLAVRRAHDPFALLFTVFCSFIRHHSHVHFTKHL